jgi:hypothetical protein
LWPRAPAACLAPASSSILSSFIVHRSNAAYSEGTSRV